MYIICLILVGTGRNSQLERRGKWKLPSPQGIDPDTSLYYEQGSTTEQCLCLNRIYFSLLDWCCLIVEVMAVPTSPVLLLTPVLVMALLWWPELALPTKTWSLSNSIQQVSVCGGIHHLLCVVLSLYTVAANLAEYIVWWVPDLFLLAQNGKSSPLPVAWTHLPSIPFWFRGCRFITTWSEEHAHKLQLWSFIFFWLIWDNCLGAISDHGGLLHTREKPMIGQHLSHSFKVVWKLFSHVR